MIDAAPWPLRFQVGARTIATVRRRLVRVPLDLADVLAGEVPVLPATPREAHGYLVTSLPAAVASQLCPWRCAQSWPSAWQCDLG